MGESFEIRVGRGAVQFSAAHFLIFGPERCEQIHGHDYRVEVAIQGLLSGPGWIVDFQLVEEQLKGIVAPLDHRLLLPASSRWLQIEFPQPETVKASLGPRTWQFYRGDCYLLPVENTSAELLAAYFGRQMREALPADVASLLKGLSVEVHETPHYSATWIWQSDEI